MTGGAVLIAGIWAGLAWNSVGTPLLISGSVGLLLGLGLAAGGHRLTRADSNTMQRRHTRPRRREDGDFEISPRTVGVPSRDRVCNFSSRSPMAIMISVQTHGGESELPTSLSRGRVGTEIFAGRVQFGGAQVCRTNGAVMCRYHCRASSTECRPMPQPRLCAVLKGRRTDLLLVEDVGQPLGFITLLRLPSSQAVSSTRLARGSFDVQHSLYSVTMPARPVHN